MMRKDTFQMDRFPNLAGKCDDKTPEAELQAAGIEMLKLPEACRYGEPKTVIMGQTVLTD